MASQRITNEKQLKKLSKPENKAQIKQQDNRTDGVAALQQSLGNRAVQRLVAREDLGIMQTGGELSQATSNRIDQARGNGQPIAEEAHRPMSEATGYDLSHVVVHTDQDADQLNHELDSRAFATGRDIFFRDGEYNPGTKDGQELIAHELTHVVQQREGQVENVSGSGMQVNTPGDVHEQEADAVAKQVVNGGQAQIQRQAEEEELLAGKAIQRQAEEEELLAGKAIQRQGEEEELIAAKPVQRQGEDEMPEAEEEAVAGKAIQRQAEEEELLAGKAIQRQGEEEELIAAKPVQRQGEDEMPEVEEEDMVAGKAVQRNELAEAEEAKQIP